MGLPLHGSARILTYGAAVDRSGFVAALVAVFLLGGVASAEDEGPFPEVTEYSGHLPGEPARDVGDPEGAAYWTMTAATVVVDAATGRPVVGARVRAYVDVPDAGAVRGASLVGHGTTDEFGLANVRHSAAFHPEHWVTLAEGYEPHYAYGDAPDERVRLRPAVPVAARIVDSWGCPVPAARVELRRGGPSGPGILVGASDAQGVFRAPSGGGGDGVLWIRAPAAATSCEPAPAALGASPATIVLDPGVTVRGRVREADGVPVHGARVLGGGGHDPATLTDADGRFVLDGVRPGAPLVIFHPSVRLSGEGDFACRFVEDVPLDLIWPVPAAEHLRGTGTLKVRLNTPQGVQTDEVTFLAVGEDGCARDLLQFDDEMHKGVELPAGTWRLRPASPFVDLEFPDTTVTFVEGEHLVVDVVARPRAVLRLAGDVPRDGLELVAAGWTVRPTHPGDVGEEGLTWLPVDAPAAVRWGPWSFPVGPAEGGVRTAVVRRPRPHRLRIQTSDVLGSVGISNPGRARPSDALAIEDGTVSVWHSGPLWLHVEHGDPAVWHTVALDLPAIDAERIERTVDVVKEALPLPPTGSVTLFVERADGEPVPFAKIVADELRGTPLDVLVGDLEAVPMEIPETGRVWVSAPGFQPLVVNLDRPGEHRVTFPAGTVVVTVPPGPGGQAATRALLDGVLHDLDASGRLVVSGLAAGPHSLVVTHRYGVGVAWKFTLEEGERREEILPL